MPKVICNTSPLQYLHQIGQLSILPATCRIDYRSACCSSRTGCRYRKRIRPTPARESQMDQDTSTHKCHSSVSNNRSRIREESQVLMLALEMPESVALLDDALARRVATTKGIPIKGTLGLLLDAKRAGHLSAVKPSLDRLQELGFRLAQQTRDAVLKLAGEL